MQIINKGKIVTTDDGTLITSWILGNILVMAITCDFLKLRKLAKEMAKAFERQNDIFGIFVYDNNGN